MHSIWLTNQGPSYVLFNMSGCALCVSIKFIKTLLSSNNSDLFISFNLIIIQDFKKIYNKIKITTLCIVNLSYKHSLKMFKFHT